MASKKIVKKKNGYEKPKDLKTGAILQEISSKKKWIVGESIGAGGFGEIYSACDANSLAKKLEHYPYVVKIEPHSNGPLFVEMHFYMRNAKKEDIDRFVKEKKLKQLGMPTFIGSGSQEIENVKHRFLVMPRYGRDIWKIFLEQNRKFPIHTVYRLGWQLLNILEYIHQKEYVHMDIKGTNILLGFGPRCNDQIYLLDYGLATHYNKKEYKIDPKKAHNGTIEYTSRDAHNGVATMRGDLEILSYVLLEFAGGTLPWTLKPSIYKKPLEVQKLKESFMKDTEKSVKSAFSAARVPLPILAFFKYVQSLKHDDTPDYKKMRGIFENALNYLKQSNIGTLEFTTSDGTKKNDTAKSPVKRAHARTNESIEKPQKQPKVLVSATESSKSEIKSKRTVERKRYVESDTDDDDGETLRKKKNVSSKKTEQPKTSEKPNENKTANKSPANKKSKEDTKTSNKGKMDDAAAKGYVVLKSSSGSSKKAVHLNFDLNVSIDSDIIVNITRKNKTKSTDEGQETDTNDVKNKAGYYKGKYAKN